MTVIWSMCLLLFIRSGKKTPTLFQCANIVIPRIFTVRHSLTTFIDFIIGFYLYTNALQWTAAKSDCEANSMKLASLNNQNTHEAASLFINVKRSITYVRKKKLNGISSLVLFRHVRWTWKFLRGKKVFDSINIWQIIWLMISHAV